MKKLKLLGFSAMLIALCTTSVSALEVTENVVLEQDYNEQFVVDGKEVVIDLNGHKITYASEPQMNQPALSLKNGAKVTLKGTGTIESTNYNGVTVESGSTFVLENGTIKSVEFGVLTTGNSTFTMNGGEIITSDNCGAGGNGSNKDTYKNYTININGGTITSNITSSGYVSCGIYHPNEGTVNIKGGTINSTNGAGVVQRGGTLNITGGTINTQEKTKDIVGKVGDSRVVVPASAVVIDKHSNYPANGTIKTNLSGVAVFNGVNKDVTILGENIDYTIKGGIYTTQLDDTLLAEGYKLFKITDGDNKDKFVVSKDEELKNTVIEGMIPEEEVSEENANLVKDTIKDKYVLATYYDIQLVTEPAEDVVVGTVTETEKPIKVTVGLPADLPKLAENYVRKYVIIRIHDGKVTIIDKVVDNGDGTISFETDKFSVYALAYVDSEKEPETTTTTTTGTEEPKTNNPKTADNTFIYVAVIGLSVIGIAGVTIYKNQKAINRI